MKYGATAGSCCAWEIASTSREYHRFSPAAQAMIARMDGTATVQQLWDRACQETPEDIPTQNEVVDLLIQLHAADLLQADMTPDATALLFATNPTTCPPRRPKAVTTSRARSGCISK